MDSITSKVNKYDLSDICAEFTLLSDPNHSVPLLQKYVGGSEVHLLLGIKNTSLDPVWIKTLPCGVAVYQSVFKDIWGSDLIFAGPHKTFTDANKPSSANHVCFGIQATTREPDRNGDLLMDGSELCRLQVRCADVKAELSPNVVQILQTNILAYNCCY